MSYISALHLRNKNLVLVWERVNGKRVVKEYPAPYYFYAPDNSGRFKSIKNERLERYDFESYNEFITAKGKKRSGLFESDISAEFKVLSEHYLNVKPPVLHTTFLDIEVDYDPKIGFSSVHNPYAPINAIAMHHSRNETSSVIAVPPPGWNKSTFDESLYELSNITFVKNEKELLRLMLEEIEDSDVLSGWNSQLFDIPYICKRIEYGLGKSFLRKMSFPEGNLPRFREVEIFNTAQTVCDLSGRIHLDYMDLFKKYEVSERPSYKLEAIADEVLPHLPKLEYEGTLADLYVNDFNHFIRYNIRDTEILKGFEQKLGYISVANAMVHTSTAQFTDVLGTLKLTDYAIINYCHNELDVKVPDCVEGIGDGAQGAFVLYPQTGMHELIGLIDINSLYPNSIRSINISPEKIIGQFANQEQATVEIFKQSNVMLLFEFETGLVEERSAQDWKNWLLNHKFSISGFGTVFDQSSGPGVLPSILADWYTKRKQFQKKKLEATTKIDELIAECKTDNKQKELVSVRSGVEMSREQVVLYDRFKDEEQYFDKLQYVYKIKLNSAYGAFLNSFFRFYDNRIGNSTTATGRMILQHQARKVSEIIDGEYDFELPVTEEIFMRDPEKYRNSSVIYCDTDSVYFKTHAKSTKQAIEIADYVASVVNASFPDFMKSMFLCTEGFDTLIKSGRELVSDRGIFVDKKRYILHVVDLDGHAVDKMKVMGLELKKTTLPKQIATQLSSFVERLLKGDDWDNISCDIVKLKDEINETCDISHIGLPKGVKGLEQYTQAYNIDPKTRLPGHVAASILWNKNIDQHHDVVSPRIVSGMKIKVYYLKYEIGRFKSIAVPTDIDTLPEWFVENFTPIINRQDQIERLVEKPLQHILTVIGKKTPSRQSMLIDSVIEY